MTSPSLRQLDIFAQMVASGSVDACARELGLPRDTVERDMAALESRLGYALFERRMGSSQLTEAGRKTVRAMALLSEQAQDEWDAIDPPPPVSPTPPLARPPADDRITLTIAAPAPVFSHFQDALTAFEEANPDIAITLDLAVHTAREAAAMLAGGAADIAYFYALGEPETPPSRYVWSEQISIYLGADHPLARADTVSLADLTGVPPLAMDRANGLRHIVEQALGRAGLPPTRPALETDNLFEIMLAVRGGEGWFAAFGPLARDFGRMAGVGRIRLADPLPPVEVRQAIRAGADQGPVAALAQFLFL